MAVFDFRLEAQDGSGHFRVGSTVAETKKEAEHNLMTMEAKKVAYRLTGEEYLEVERIANEYIGRGEKPPARVRAQIATHEQLQPYKLVHLEQRKGK